MLSQAELDSRTHIAIEKYIKQLGIEAETMVSMARNQILPAALQHQQRSAEAIAATKAAGVECADTTARSESFVELVTKLRNATARSSGPRRITMPIPMQHAAQISRELKPAMAELRTVVDSAGDPRGGGPLAAADVSGFVVFEVSSRLEMLRSASQVDSAF